MAKITLFNGSPVSANAELNPGMAAGYGRSVEGLADAVDTHAKKVAGYVSSGDTGPGKMIGTIADMLGNLHDTALDQSDAVNQKLGGFNKIRDAEQQLASSVQDLSGAEGKTGGKAVQKLREKYVKTTADIADQVAKGIDNPEAKAALLSEFERYQKLGAQNFTEKVRNLAQSEQETSFYKNLDELSKTATINGPEGLQQAQSMLTQALADSTASGLITSEKAEALQAQIGKRILNTLHDNAVAKDPQQVINDIKMGKYNYLSDADKLGLYNKAQTVYTDFISKARIQDDITGAADRDRMAALQTQLQLGIQDGTIDRTQLMKYEEQLGDKGFNAMNSLLQKKIFDDAVKANDRLKLSDMVARGEDLSDVPAKDINNHFKESVVAARREAETKGTQISELGLEATVAARYNVPVKAFTSRLENFAMRGTPEQQEEAYNAWKTVQSLRGDNVTKDIPDSVKERFAIVDNAVNYGGRSVGEAFAEVQELQDRMSDPAVKAQAEKAYRDSEFSKPEFNVSSLLNEVVGDTTIFDLEADAHTNAEVNALLKNMFIKYGSSEKAKAAASVAIKKTFGVNRVNGVNRIMAHAPSTQGYNDVLVTKALNMEISNNHAPLPAGYGVNNMYLQADENTLRDIRNKVKDPRYLVTYDFNGLPTPVYQKDDPTQPLYMTLEGAR